MDGWLKESHSSGHYVAWKIEKTIYEENTGVQDLAIVELAHFGRALILDGAVQTTIGDEFIYHEMIVHVAMNTHPEPRRILIIGGGDGGTMREVLKHSSVERVDLVEIDRRVIEVCQEFLPEIASGFQNPRSRIFIEDGIAFVKNSSEKYDVIIIDSSDPIGPAQELFKESFYKNCRDILNDDGIMVAHAESPVFFEDTFLEVIHNMKRLFAIQGVYLTAVPTYISGFWAFVIGSKKYDPAQPPGDKPPIHGLKYYNKQIHNAAFVLPPFIEGLLT
ncbi:MAG: polyamine aminopropyltransferase [Candidatus Saccharibacteria bacterium]